MKSFKEIRENKFEVKYAKSKRGPIKVTKFMDLESAKKFLAQKRKEGMNGIISRAVNLSRKRRTAVVVRLHAKLMVFKKQSLLLNKRQSQSL